MDNNVLSIKDLGSKNKTWINDESIPAERSVKIYIEDIIKVGRTKFKIMADGLTAEESLSQTSSRTSREEFTFILENPISANEKEEEEEEEEDTGHSITFINTAEDKVSSDVGTGIAHTMSKMVKTTFGIIKQRYSTTTNKKRKARENEIEIDQQVDQKLELNTVPFRGAKKKGQKYKKFKNTERQVAEKQPVPELSGKPTLLSPKAKLLVIFVVIGIIICYFLSS